MLDSLAERFEGELAWSEIRKKTTYAIDNEAVQIRHRILVSADRAKDVVGDMIATICLNDIESGSDHVYRGTLSMTGQSKRNIFAGIVTDQLRDGWVTLHEAASANENMKRAVAEAG